MSPINQIRKSNTREWKPTEPRPNRSRNRVVPTEKAVRCFVGDVQRQDQCQGQPRPLQIVSANAHRTDRQLAWNIGQPPFPGMIP